MKLYTDYNSIISSNKVGDCFWAFVKVEWPQCILPNNDLITIPNIVYYIDFSDRMATNLKFLILGQCYVIKLCRVGYSNFHIVNDSIWYNVNNKISGTVIDIDITDVNI